MAKIRVNRRRVGRVERGEKLQSKELYKTIPSDLSGRTSPRQSHECWKRMRCMHESPFVVTLEWTGQACFSFEMCMFIAKQRAMHCVSVLAALSELRSERLYCLWWGQLGLAALQCQEDNLEIASAKEELHQRVKAAASARSRQV